MTKTSVRSTRSRGAYGPEVAEELCALIAGGHGLAAICAREDMPSKNTVYNWRKGRPPFAAAYDAALAAAGGPRHGGRPKDYSEAAALALCQRLEEGQAMHVICRQTGMPTQGTVNLWLNQRPEFAAMVGAAREIQAQRLYDEIREIADATTPATLQVNRIRIAARQWQAAKLTQRKTSDVAGPRATGGFNVRIVDFDDDEDGAAH